MLLDFATLQPKGEAEHSSPGRNTQWRVPSLSGRTDIRPIVLMSQPGSMPALLVNTSCIRIAGASLTS